MRHDSSPITAICLYRDMSGIIRFCSATSKSQQNSMPQSQNTDDDIEDLDDILLYGDSKKKQQQRQETRSKRRIIGMKPTVANTHFDTDVVDPNAIVPSHWIVLARENGNVYIYSIPEMHLVYMVKKFSHLPNIATDQPYIEDELATEVGDSGGSSLADGFAAKPEEVIVELVYFR